MNEYKMNEYKEILKLKQMLEDANIPFEFSEIFDGYQIRLNDDIDAVEYRFSYGSDNDLIEIMGALTEDEELYDSVLGHLTAEEVFERFKYCYENNTIYYCEPPIDLSDDEAIICGFKVNDIIYDSFDEAFAAQQAYATLYRDKGNTPIEAVPVVRKSKTNE